MALPKEPRQKMINLMYLVLTALLALNVSSEILNAFKTVDASLINSNNVIDEKNNTLFKSFAEKIKDPATRERAELWGTKADKAKSYSDAVSQYIDGLKLTLKKEAGLDPVKGTFKEDALEPSTRLFVENKEGANLLKKLTEFRNNLLAIDDSMAKDIGSTLPLNLNPPANVNSAAAKGDWGYTYFHMTPTVAALTILSKFQNDVKNSEALVVDYCHRKTGEVKIIFDQFQPLASQSSEYLMPGQELTIQGGVGAFSKAAQPTVTIDGQNIPLNADGVAEFKTNVGGPGSYSKKVVISFKKPDGTPGVLEKEIKYTVGSPTGASVSADAVKVLYIGLDNPLSVSGGNVGDERVTASIDNGELVKQGNGKYIARPRSTGKANITLSIDGKPQAFEFRVKNVPDPVAKVGNNKGGQMGVNEFKAQFGVRADLENFVFEGVKFNVTGFTLVMTGANFPNLQYRQVQGDSFDKVRDLIEKAKQGTTVSIDEIKASGPGGTRTLAPIVFNLR
ncbi:gliding motility protein GldM [Panacibacter ginsenosidivorans]|uniref:Gliding motility protein GldM n=1 Tax=Panacibacter ginsenosidivorans TaxID=1813871 RepID=A0A5B8V9X2_9BACT|nr:gliding motility protein GldM [Panacibacter ginsenosidivorans]QEC67516.1 gliding motility protein GldM [Panacibacter ginsenosidivorans]